MARAGDVLENPATGDRLTFLQTAAETDGAVLEYELRFRPGGFAVRDHLHPRQSELHHVLEGELWTVVAGADGPPRVGAESRQLFKGRLPYRLKTRSTIARFEPPGLVEADVAGDLRGKGVWTLTERDGGTHVRFDWRVYADRGFIRVLTPVLRPAFRANHNWAIKRAMEGLEPYARRQAA